MNIFDIMDSCLFEDLSRVYKMTWSASGQHRSTMLTVVWCTYTVDYGCQVSWSADFGTFVRSCLGFISSLVEGRF